MIRLTDFRIYGDSSGIARITILDGEKFEAGEIPSELKLAVHQLDSYFKGELQEFQLKINPEGTAFQKRVWQALMEIPFGSTVSYLQLARQLGDLKAIRAVAAANGRNPLWIVVPCHRVIGTNGSLTGYAGGLWRKQWLLNHENPPLQQELF
ncbi:methylated-DNA--[protein]-cysteine S-methyltransferase [Antarcticibacterium flavum]|uniref:Methylated-DNA--protein-cysteine methyltransferase n=1 Tax=Antarcticibacterium flavum TaxID=2058175 RepID=A0A5B7X365_9FLAO|nr:cysteine methyltransferase [Antarcticibacterium sp. W02-3]QCY69730.1 methylated-DNA--[protein]-cysteine S-methyltransferase [Antarcticibacterium flavum]